VGPGQRAPESVVRYELGAVVARRRAASSAAIGACTALAPLLLGVELLPRVGWSPTPTFWAVAAAIVVLIVVRTVVSYSTAVRRLVALRVTLEDDVLSNESASDRLAIPRARIARMVEIHGALGGISVESEPDTNGVVLVVSVPRGGERFGEMRAALERWRTIERRPRLGLGVRVLFGAGIVAAIFFLPFLLDDFARTKAVAALLVVLAWGVTRWTMRGR
jgi:hypothetical protein